jgi:diguanylate cyclase (GGDEF)-like protein
MGTNSPQSGPDLESIARRLKDQRVPSPSGVAISLIRLAGRDDVEISEVAAVLKRDPSLTAKIIQLSNSPLYIGRRPILAVEDAIIRVGLSALSQLAVGITLLSSRHLSCTGFDLRHFWTQSLAMAISAQTIARRAGGFSPAEMFTLGLLLDFGCLAMACAYPDLYQGVIEKTAGKGNAALRAEECKVFEFDHRLASAALLGEWGFPQPFVQAIIATGEEGELLSSHRLARLSQLIDLSRRIGDLAGNQNSPQALSEALDLIPRLDLDPDAFQEILAEVSTRWPNWCHLLGLDIDPTRTVRELEKLRARIMHPAPVVESTPSILLLSVNADLAAVVRKALGSQPYELTQVSTIELVIAPGANLNPAILIIDLPAGSLEDKIAMVRSLRIVLGARVYFILLDAKESIEMQALREGVDSVLPTPLQPALLVSRVQVATRVAGQMQRLEQERLRSEQTRQQLTALSRELEREAMTDVLTGLPNRRYANEFISNVWGIAERHGTALSCMIVDLDHFKKINDTYGHDVGDQIMRFAADLLRTKTRPGDAVCRYGGDEFLIICPHTDLVACTGLAVRMRDTFERHVGNHPAVTIGVGIAERSADLMSKPDDLIHAADRALLRAKRLGCNRVAVDDRE